MIEMTPLYWLIYLTTYLLCIGLFAVIAAIQSKQKELKIAKAWVTKQWQNARGLRESLRTARKR